MADNSRVQMDTTGAGSLSGRRVLDKLTSIDRNMALMQKDIRTLVKKSAAERGSAFFAKEDASEFGLTGGLSKLNSGTTCFSIGLSSATKGNTCA